MKNKILIFMIAVLSVTSYSGSSMSGGATEFTQYKRYIDELDKRRNQAETWINQNLTLEAQLKRLSQLGDEQLLKLWNADKDRFRRMGRTVDNLTKSIKNVASIENLMSEKIKYYSTQKLSESLAESYRASLQRTNSKLDDIINENDITASVKSTGDRVSAILGELGKADSPTKTVTLLLEALQASNQTVLDMEQAYVEAQTDKQLKNAQIKAEKELDEKLQKEAVKKAEKDMKATQKMAKMKAPSKYDEIFNSYYKKPSGAKKRTK